MGNKLLVGRSQSAYGLKWFCHYDGETFTFEHKSMLTDFINANVIGEVKQKMLKQLSSPRWAALAKR